MTKIAKCVEFKIAFSFGQYDKWLLYYVLFVPTTEFWKHKLVIGQKHSEQWTVNNVWSIISNFEYFQCFFDWNLKLITVILSR